MGSGDRKLIVGILFGGRSAEHEISLLSAKNVYDAMDRNRFEPVLIGIDKTGKWHLCDDSQFLLNEVDTSGIPVVLAPGSSGQLLSFNSSLLTPHSSFLIS